MSAERARYVMLGGFLGSGKTTAVARLARHLTERGRAVGLITNDQSTGLVDTALLASQGFPVEEIGGGCFCCRFTSLSEAVAKLTEGTRPDVFVAEPVGSCTDLLATVSYPLRRIYGERYAIAPLSVLVDPLRAERVLGLEPGRSFSPKVRYVYEKQLEEAELLVVNKLDLLRDARVDGRRLARLTAALAERYPRARIFPCSARDGTGLEPWFAAILGEECRPRETMELDYRLYAEGEARLGWLNATLRLESEAPFDAGALLRALVEGIRARLPAGTEIAHLKLTLDAGLASGQLAALSLVSHDGEVDERETLLDRVEGGSLVLNLRAEAAPEELERALVQALRATLAAPDAPRWRLEHLERFRPAPPVPVQRITSPAPSPTAGAAPR
jgi:G3E family GTPase